MCFIRITPHLQICQEILMLYFFAIRNSVFMMFSKILRHFGTFWKPLVSLNYQLVKLKKTVPRFPYVTRQKILDFSSLWLLTVLRLWFSTWRMLITCKCLSKICITLLSKINDCHSQFRTFGTGLLALGLLNVSLSWYTGNCPSFWMSMCQESKNWVNSSITAAWMRTYDCINKAQNWNVKNTTDYFQERIAETTNG